MLKLQRKLQAGFTIIELLIVIAIIGILATLVLTNFQGAQAKGRDVTRKSDINSLYQKLEEFYNENGGYPDGALTVTNLAGIDAGAFLDSDGNDIQESFTASTTKPTLAPVNTNTAPASEYLYGGYSNCNTAAPTGFSCEKYIVATFLEKESQFEKDSLN